MAKKLITIQVPEGSFVLTPAQFNAAKKCFSKWNKLIEKKKKSIERWGSHYGNHDPSILNVSEQFVSDLKRLMPVLDDKENSK